MSDEDKSYDELPAEVTISVTREELNSVAKKVGLDDGRALYAMLVAPSAAGDVGDYENCVIHCSNLFEGDALVACIEGCAKVTSSFTAPTVGPATRS
ncbi:hypothetical protein C2R22_04685 [Salinigranum rubrum]|uniref:Uncharacterized protein n=1 Tax=Salinigranum rubrum TaxID=755307 RepID=A0A2I8VGN0_9EURY|nr:hypothetical protein [Salinigranum rubrum]AUV81044.1 hypothetical protein C2R22_04685 [Salinigranum rubrum]